MSGLIDVIPFHNLQQGRTLLVIGLENCEFLKLRLIDNTYCDTKEIIIIEGMYQPTITISTTLKGTKLPTN